jgi:hypothetical protein
LHKPVDMLYNWLKRETGTTPRAIYAVLLLALVAAAFLRIYRLDQVPAGVDYDEAGNFILAQEIATGQSHPIFVRAYAGREAIFYWLAAASMRLLGRTLFAFRLAAALCSVGTVWMAYLLAGEMFRDAPAAERRWVPPLGAVLTAVSYWHVHVSRYGFRVNTMPLFLAVLMWLLWRGLRRDNWLELALGGLVCGLAANTYLAVRAFPLVLAAFAAWVIAAWRPQGVTGSKWRWRRVRQLALFGAAALVTLAPLAVFFIQNPQFFSTRMDQASILDPTIRGAALWKTLGRVTLDALGIFTIRGDSNPVYNLDQRPIFGPVLGVLFYAGLALCAWRGRPTCLPSSGCRSCWCPTSSARAACPIACALWAWCRSFIPYRRWASSPGSSWPGVAANGSLARPTTGISMPQTPGGAGPRSGSPGMGRRWAAC